MTKMEINVPDRLLKRFRDGDHFRARLAPTLLALADSDRLNVDYNVEHYYEIKAERERRANMTPEEREAERKERFREKRADEFKLVKKHIKNVLNSQNKLDLTMQSRLVSYLSKGDLKIASAEMVTKILHNFLGHGLSEIRVINNRGQTERYYYVTGKKKQKKKLKKRLKRVGKL